MKKSIVLALAFALVMCLGVAGCAQGNSAGSAGSAGGQGSAGEGGPIGIIGAMDVEVESLKDAADVQEVTTIAGMEFCEGTLNGQRVVIVKCGMGKVNAGICANTLINDFGCTQVINTGVAGSLDPRMDIGDIVVSTDAVQHDFDVSPIGFDKGEIPYTGLYAFPADEELRAAAVQAVRDVAPDVNVFEGRVCSGDQFITTQEQKDAITSNFGGLCCEMEGAAIAQACYLNDVPFVVVRAISDKPGSTQAEDYQAFEAKAAERCAAIVEHMVAGSSVSGDVEQTRAIDYLALVNKLNPLPDGWEDALETVHFTNSVGDDVEVEAKAYDAYLELKADLEAEGIYVDLDSARRSVADQERIMADFTEKYGADYAKKTVATPGYSEHHTGLALDLYLIIDGEDIVENEDMIQYPEVWEKIHAKLADHGFILRYTDGDEHITGYGYEPWHIRYIDDPAIAKEITDAGITFEEYKAGKTLPEVSYDFDDSSLYTREDLEEAAVQVKCEFATFEGCELHSLRYAGDEANTPENLAWLNDHDDDPGYTQVAKFVSDFHSPAEGGGAWEADKEYTDYEWWLARTDDGGWQLVTFGY